MRPWPALLAAVAMPVVSILAVTTVSAAPTRPDETRPTPSPITDRFSLRGSYYSPAVDTVLRLDSTPAGTMGTLITAENDLGQDDDIDQGRMELVFRLGERYKLRVDYFKTDRFAAQAIQRDIVFGDSTFAANQVVTSSIDWRMLGFTNTYALYRDDRVEVGMGIGIHLLEAEIRGEVGDISNNVREEASGAGAFPTVALDATWRISRRFALTARGQYFDTTVNDFRGLLSDYHGDVQFRWRPNVAFGLGYTSIRAKLDVATNDFPGRFNLKVVGPEAFVRVSF